MADSNPSDPASSPFTPYRAGEAFLVQPPDDKPGPGVLILHSWWGLTDWVKDFATRVADEGFTVLAPDLLGGARPTTAAEGETALAEVDADELSGLVMSSAHTVRAASEDPEHPIGVIGFSMGASLGMWLSARLTSEVGAVVSFYGTQAIDFDNATARYQGHFADNDPMVSEDDRVVTESFLRLGGRETEFHVYPGTAHWFFEPGETFDEQAAELAWERTISFLKSTLT